MSGNDSRDEPARSGLFDREQRAPDTLRRRKPMAIGGWIQAVNYSPTELMLAADRERTHALSKTPSTARLNSGMQ